MKKIRYIVLFSVIISLTPIVYSGCAKPRISAKPDSCYFELYFGKTGGFTNINPTFEIKSNGEIYKRNSYKTEFYLLKKVEKSAIDSIFNLLIKSRFNELSIKEVSNMTNFIEVKSDKINNKITWYQDSQIPDDIKKLQQFVHKIIN
jgi:hypothetical protein